VLNDSVEALMKNKRKKIQTPKSMITEVITLTNKHKFHFLNVVPMNTRDKRDQRELESSAEDRFLRSNQ
jgi:hypothetical protein